MGSLVLLVHAFADHWLELAKMARYVQYQVITITEEERGVLRNVAQNQCSKLDVANVQRVCDVAFFGFLMTNDETNFTLHMIVTLSYYDCQCSAGVRRCLLNVCPHMGLHPARSLPNLPHLLNKVLQYLIKSTRCYDISSTQCLGSK